MSTVLFLLRQTRSRDEDHLWQRPAEKRPAVVDEVVGLTTSFILTVIFPYFCGVTQWQTIPGSVLTRTSCSASWFVKIHEGRGWSGYGMGDPCGLPFLPAIIHIPWNL